MIGINRLTEEVQQAAANWYGKEDVLDPEFAKFLGYRIASIIVEAMGGNSVESTPLTFERLRYWNVMRCQAPTPQGFDHALESWSALEWAGAMCGEAGEAANKAKKIRRLEMYNDAERARSLNKEDVAAMDVAREVADVVIYADLLVAQLGLDLGEVVREKFNATSENIGSDIHL